MRIFLLTVTGALFFFSWGVTYANDSIARVSTGGIVFVKSELIRMAHETLEISPKLIRVKYRFVNESSQDIHTTVAFPTPEYGWNPGLSPSEDNIRPLRPFKVYIDGAPVQTSTQRKAVAGKRDVTEELRKIGLGEKQIFETFGECKAEEGVGSCKFTEKQKSQLALLFGKSGVREISDITAWKVSEVFYWEQIFPAGKSIEVVHEYAPFVGMINSAPYQRGYKEMGELPAYSKASESEACLDEKTKLALEKRIKSLAGAGAEMVYVSLRDIEYILATGRNWKGPIGEFKLRIVKDSADQFVSLCFPGKPKKISPTVIEFNHRNLVPQDRLVIYFYTVGSISK